jgi:hypothetical protein
MARKSKIDEGCENPGHCLLPRLMSGEISNDERRAKQRGETRQALFCFSIGYRPKTAESGFVDQ